MKRFSTVVLLALFVAVSAGPAISADITQAELMQVPDRGAQRPIAFRVELFGDALLPSVGDELCHS
jgi:hypothetical protein